jgi:hypothetical protein
VSRSKEEGALRRNKEYKAAYDRAWRKKNADHVRNYDRARASIKKNARSRIRKRIMRGSLIRQACDICGDPKSQAHHHDYTKPLEVRWLCAQHHKDAHHG